MFLPAKAPGRAAFVQVFSPGPRNGSKVSATILYLVPKPGGGCGNLWVHESAEPEQPVPQPTETWEQVDGFMVGTDPGMGYLRCKVLLEREGHPHPFGEHRHGSPRADRRCPLVGPGGVIAVRP